MKYCRHCGTGMEDNAAVCLNCGISENTPVKKEMAYCKNCGAEMNSQAAICVKCGVSQTNKKSYAAPASGGNSSGKLTRSANGKILAGVFSGPKTVEHQPVDFESRNNYSQFLYHRLVYRYCLCYCNFCIAYGRIINSDLVRRGISPPFFIAISFVGGS